MGRGKQLTDFEKGQILAYKSLGQSIAEISRLVNRSWHVVNNFIEDPGNYGTKKSPGRPNELTPQDHRRILRLSSNKQISAE